MIMSGIMSNNDNVMISQSNDLTHLGPSDLVSPKGGSCSIDGDSKSVLL